MEYTPYVYLIGWSRLDMWYLGSETSNTYKVANPQNLWTSYFTSSKRVKKFHEENGDPDVIEVRKIFVHGEDAVNWENKAIKRLGAVKSGRWLNASYRLKGLTFFGPHNEESKKILSEKAKGNTKAKGLTNEYRRANGMKLITGRPKGSLDSEEGKKNRSDSKKGKILVSTEEGNRFVSVDDQDYKSGKWSRVFKIDKFPTLSEEATARKLVSQAKARAPVDCPDCGKSIRGLAALRKHQGSKLCL